jgi:hypothetical protein
MFLKLSSSNYSLYTGFNDLLDGLVHLYFDISLDKSSAGKEVRIGMDDINNKALSKMSTELKAEIQRCQEKYSLLLKAFKDEYGNVNNSFDMALIKISTRKIVLKEFRGMTLYIEDEYKGLMKLYKVLELNLNSLACSNSKGWLDTRDQIKKSASDTFELIEGRRRRLVTHLKDFNRELQNNALGEFYKRNRIPIRTIVNDNEIILSCEYGIDDFIKDKFKDIYTSLRIHSFSQDEIQNLRNEYSMIHLDSSEECLEKCMKLFSLYEEKLQEKIMPAEIFAERRFKTDTFFN